MIGLDTVYGNKRGKFVNNYSKQQLANIDKVYNYLINTHKLTPILAVALMGNIMQESSWDPKVKQVKGDEAIGLFQLHGDLLKAYRKYLRSTGKSEDNILSPIDYVIDMIKGVKESNGKYLAPHPYTTEYNRVYNLVKPNLGKANLTKLLQEDIKYYNKTYGKRISLNRLHLLDELLTAWNNPDTSIKDLTTIFTDVFERAGEPEYDKRASYALEYYNYYNPSYKVGGKLNKYKTGGLIKKLQFGGNPMAFSTYVSPKAVKQIASGLNEGTKQIASEFNTLMSKLGETAVRLATSGASTDYGQTSPFAFSSGEERREIARGREKARQKANEFIADKSVYISPSNHVAAWTQGSFSPRVGAKFLASDPRLLSLGIIGDILTFKYTKPTTSIIKDVFKTSNNPFNWRNYKFLGDRRFYSDLIASPYSILSERKYGNYPLTFAERRKYITDFKNDVLSGIDYAKLEAATNLKVPLKEGWVLDPIDKIWRNKINMLIQDIEITPHFGTLKATKVYRKTPWNGNYSAFETNGEIFFPFRSKPNTLRTHLYLNSSLSRKGVGAHESRHVFLDLFLTPLNVYRSKGHGSYNRYANKELPQDFRTNLRSFIKNAETAGEWQGSLLEMDAELTGWGAEHGLPSKYSEMTPQQKALVYDLFQKRFGGNSNYSLYNDVHGILNSPNIEPKSTFELNIDNSKIGKILQGLETLGYRKQGGKIWKKN